MTSFVTSADGTEIAYDRLGDGPPIVVIGGIFNTRQTMRALADELALELTAINFDRRGRGDSGDAAPYAVEREVEDLAALIEGVGGAAAVYGHSSGAGLALHAAAAGPPITRLVVHEPPFSEDDDESRQSARRARRRTCSSRSRRTAAPTPSDGSWGTWGCPDALVDGISHDPGHAGAGARRCSTTSR